ncbi:MAG: selenium metabolism-associated LysR family transcriptional regulator [Actinobacteria bacterium]|nr:selenium metabolism-associated LysR family transcriptional regulator [Actinomycetota bacterium]
MNLRQLETFLLVADLQSFTAAARKLFMSQPAVSFQIKSLEEDLQVTLFQRGDKRLSLTPAGRLIYPEAKKMVARYQKIRSGIEDMKGLKTGHLVVGASTTPGEYLMPLIVGEFCKVYPGITISLQVAGSGQVFRWIKDNEIDIGVTGSPATGSGIWCEPWVSDNLVLIVPPGHRWAGRGDLAADELLEEPFVLREPGSGTRRSFEKKLAEKDIDADRIKVSMEISSTRAVITAVQAGLGVAVVSSLAAGDALELGRIKSVPPPFDSARMLYLAGNKQSHESPVTNEFLEYAGKIRHGG